MLKRSLYGALAALAFAVTPALALEPGPNANFRYLTESAPNAWFDRSGMFLADYDGTIAPTLLNSPFEVFCVDRETSIDPVVDYDVFVTPIDPSSDFSNTRAGSFDSYYRAAALVYLYFFNGGTPGGDSNAYQWAIWSIMENTNAYDYIPGVAPLHAWALALNPGANPTLFTDWRVLTDAACDDAQPEHCYQELIYKSGSPPTEIVPEPATMSLLALGLAGMAGANLRRRKNRS